MKHGPPGSQIQTATREKAAAIASFIFLISPKIQSTSILIEERKEIGFCDEGHRKKDRYNEYINALKEYLRKLDA